MVHPAYTPIQDILRGEQTHQRSPRYNEGNASASKGMGNRLKEILRSGPTIWASYVVIYLHQVMTAFAPKTFQVT